MRARVIGLRVGVVAVHVQDVPVDVAVHVLHDVVVAVVEEKNDPRVNWLTTNCFCNYLKKIDKGRKKLFEVRYVLNSIHSKVEVNQVFDENLVKDLDLALPASRSKLHFWI